MRQQQPGGEAETTDSPFYFYKPSLMGAPFTFQLDRDALAWSKGRHSGRIAYRDISRLRLSFRPVTMQTHRYQLEIWSPGTPRLLVISGSWRSVVEMQSQGPAYSAFVLDLHRRIAEAGGTPRLETGIWPPMYWFSVVLCAGTSLGLLVLALRALQVGAWGGAVFIVGFLGLLLWQAGNFLRRNRPGDYRLDALPPVLLPSS